MIIEGVLMLLKEVSRVSKGGLNGVSRMLPWYFRENFKYVSRGQGCKKIVTAAPVVTRKVSSQ